jgi:hypothetical protein
MTFGRRASRIGFATTLVAVYLGSGALATLHLLRVEHVPCPHAGEWVHADGDHHEAPPEGLAWSSDRAPAASDHDDRHCTLASHVRAQGVGAPPQVVSTAPAAVVSWSPVPVPEDGWVVSAALRLAPKHSPPA